MGKLKCDNCSKELNDKDHACALLPGCVREDYFRRCIYDMRFVVCEDCMKAILETFDYNIKNHPNLIDLRYPEKCHEEEIPDMR